MIRCSVLLRAHDRDRAAAARGLGIEFGRLGAAGRGEVVQELRVLVGVVLAAAVSVGEGAHGLASDVAGDLERAQVLQQARSLSM